VKEKIGAAWTTEDPPQPRKRYGKNRLAYKHQTIAYSTREKGETAGSHGREGKTKRRRTGGREVTRAHHLSKSPLHGKEKR